MNNHQLPPKDDDFVAFLGRHLVVAIFNYETIETDGKVSSRHTHTVTGWLIEMFDRLFWVTAGHCLKEIDDPLREGHIRVTRCLLMDKFGWKAQHNNEVYYPYELGDAFYLWEPETGFDFAILPLRPFYRDQILKNGNEPINRSNWTHQSDLRFELYRMIGVPEDHVFRTPQSDGYDDVQLQPALMAVNRTTYENVISEDLRVPPKSEEWFFGRLDPGTGNQTVKGMSGGPIFGFRRNQNGQWTYHVAALQSWWDEKKRIIFGCSLPYFGEWLHARFTEFFQTHPDSEPD